MKELSKTYHDILEDLWRLWVDNPDCLHINVKIETLTTSGIRRRTMHSWNNIALTARSQEAEEILTNYLLDELDRATEERNTTKGAHHATNKIRQAPVSPD